VLKFSIALTAAALLAWLGVVAGAANEWIETAPSFYRETLAFLFLTTLIIFYKLTHVRDSMFVQFYLLSMAVKLLAYASFNLVIVLKDRVGAAENVIYFMLVYTTFTILEIAFLYRRFSSSAKA
jgi:hypothetical protein